MRWPWISRSWSRKRYNALLKYTWRQADLMIGVLSQVTEARQERDHAWAVVRDIVRERNALRRAATKAAKGEIEAIATALRCAKDRDEYRKICVEHGLTS